MMLTICYGLSQPKKISFDELAIPVASEEFSESLHFGGVCSSIVRFRNFATDYENRLGCYYFENRCADCCFGNFICNTDRYPIGKRIWNNRKNRKFQNRCLCHQQVNKRKLYTALAIFALLIILFVVQLFDVAVSAAICALLCILTEPFRKKSFSDMKWDIVIWLASVMGLEKH